jgi:hypothetical protein
MSKTAKRKSRTKWSSQAHRSETGAPPPVAPPCPRLKVEHDIPARESPKPAREWSIVPYVVSVFLVLPNFYWVLRDQTVWPWDQAWYAEVSVDLWYVLTHHPGQWPAAMLSAFGSKTPGVAWFGQFFVPLSQAAGSIEIGLMLSILAAYFGTLLLMYRIGLELSAGSRSVALFGTLFAASAPLSAAMTHQYLVESLQVFAVTYLFWIATAAPKFGRLRLLAHLLTATSLAVLAKSTSPLYCGLAGVLAVYSLFRVNSWVKDRQDGTRSFALLFIGSILAAGALGWYAHNFQQVVAFAKLATSGPVALNYGSAGTFAGKLLYWLRATQVSFFVPFAIPALSLIVFAGIYLAWTHGYRIKPKHENLMAAAALIHVFLVLALFSFQVNEENRYLLPLLPSIGICLMWVLSLSNRPLPGTLACILLAIQLVVTTAQALNLSKVNPSVSYWLKPYWSDGTARAELGELIRITSVPSTEFRYNIVGVELPWLNANSLAFYAAKRRLETGTRSYFTSLGYAETDIEKAWTRLEQIKISYFVSLEEDKLPDPPDFVNRVTLPILRRVVSAPDFARVDFPSRLGILLFRRTDGSARGIRAPVAEELAATALRTR